MRKGTIKAAVLAAVFIGAVLIFGRFMNDTNEDLTTEMKEATLPVITMYQGDQELNELHGYVTEMDAAYMRDTITPVTVLGLLGDRYEPVTQQICLGYAFGDGRQTSCEVTVEAVGNLLGGQTIDQYLAMGLDGISTLNDLAGGVTVTLEDDFSAIDPAMTKGTTLTLQGEQAETYVRSRRSVGVGTNEARMARQESYIRQLSVQLDEKLQKDQNFAVDAYDALQPYLTTSMAKGQLVNEAWAAKDYTRLDTIKPDGTYQVGEDGFMEFYPEAASLQQAVLQLFYEKVE